MTLEKRIVHVHGVSLPDSSVEDAIERLVFLAKIEEGLVPLDRGEGIPHVDAKRRLFS